MSQQLFQSQEVLAAIARLREAIIAEVSHKRWIRDIDVDIDVAIVQHVTGETLVDGLAGPRTLRTAIEWVTKKWRNRDPVHAPR